MKSVMNHSFSEAPTADIPRSNFNRTHGHKTAFDAGKLIPIYVDEALPGDTFSMDPTIFARLATPTFPIMDNIFLDVHFFSVPVRQIWDNFRKFCGEQVDPGDSTDYTIPTTTIAAGVTESSLYDYMGVPTQQTNTEISALYGRAYNHIYNEWFRDQNLIDSATVDTGDGPDASGNYIIRRRGKRHDYFTSALPWLQKGDAVNLPLGTSAPLRTTSGTTSVQGNVEATNRTLQLEGGTGKLVALSFGGGSNENLLWTDNIGLETDLSLATASTVNELRQAFQIQKLLERDARSGTRYSEIVHAHFGVNFIDVTYRPEFLGGNSTPVNISQVPQTSQSANTPQGTLAAYGTALNQNGGFTKSFTEHCIIMGIASVRADLTYQQGLNKMFSRSTRYDYYWPALAHIGEQAVLNGEIYYVDPTTDTGSTGTPDNERVFGYQERWAEYRYKPSIITSTFRTNAAAPLDAWHLSQWFTTTPSLDQTFIEEDPPIDRAIAVPAEPHFIVDCYFNLQCARPMPLFSVPGLIDHF